MYLIHFSCSHSVLDEGCEDLEKTFFVEEVTWGTDENGVPIDVYIRGNISDLKIIEKYHCTLECTIGTGEALFARLAPFKVWEEDQKNVEASFSVRKRMLAESAGFIIPFV